MLNTALLNIALLPKCWQAQWVFSGCLRLFGLFELLYWKSMMWFAIQTADAPSPLVSITATWTESSLQGPTDTDSFASLSFFPHEQPAPDFFYPTESAACPLAPSFFSLSTHTSSLIFFFFFVTLMPLLSCCTTVPLYLPLSSLPGGIYQAAGAGGLQHRLCQPTLWTWD